MTLSDEQLESIAQAITHEDAVTYITAGRSGRSRTIWMFGADLWRQWELTIPGFVAVVDRCVELWDRRA